MDINPYRAALLYLWDGKKGHPAPLGKAKDGNQEYICHCLEAAYRDDLTTHKEANDAKTLILRGITPHDSYKTWMRQQLGNPDGLLGHVHLQDARRRWLLWLADLWDYKPRLMIVGGAYTLSWSSKTAGAFTVATNDKTFADAILAQCLTIYEEEEA